MKKLKKNPNDAKKLKKNPNDAQTKASIEDLDKQVNTLTYLH